ncbi:helix-turn-helix transcriptional regulator [uncultured Oscillibacter sp.]|uniref:helix-turn-helix domain-containing protein n=1 Tax=uncultured Oscillibacter sp. TaxID=876091 RepID=UPI0026149A8B|nr:helix-turn-helix transcriptional regulator [uncultured Oscillibacter sp.]
MLRQQYKSLLSRFLSGEVRKYRTQYRLTQEQLSERLCMAPRSYADLEHGVCGCSGLTVVLFLLLLKDEEALQLLHSARKVLEEANRHDVA